MSIMAKTVVTQVTDDLDGSGNAETVEFSYSGKSYSIDLSKKNRTAMDKALQPYLDAATIVRGPGRRRTTGGNGSRRSSTTDLSAIRIWAAEAGYDVSSRGRIPGAVLEAYEAAH